MRLSIFLFFMILILISCNTYKSKNDDLTYKIVYQSSYGGNETESLIVIHDKKQLDEFLTNKNFSDESLLIFKSTNFKENNLVVLNLGLKNTGGYSISVEKVEIEDENLIIYKKVGEPIAGEPVTMALTNPYCIIKTSKFNKYYLK